MHDSRGVRTRDQIKTIGQSHFFKTEYGFRCETSSLPMEKNVAGKLPELLEKGIDTIFQEISNTQFSLGIICEYEEYLECSLREVVLKAKAGLKKIRPSLSLQTEASGWVNDVATHAGIIGPVLTFLQPHIHCTDALLEAIFCVSPQINHCLWLSYHKGKATLTLYRCLREIDAINSPLAISFINVFHNKGFGLESLWASTTGRKFPAPLQKPSLEKIAKQLMIPFHPKHLESYGCIVVSKAGEVSPSLQAASEVWLKDRKSMFLGLLPNPPQFTLQLSAACASVNVAMHLSRGFLLSGAAKAMMVVGVEHPTKEEELGLASLRTLSKTFAKPFDRNRDGIQLGSGGGVIILEQADHAVAYLDKTSLYIRAEHPTKTSFEGVCQVMKRCQPAHDQIDAIHAHATGTLEGDATEAKAIAKMFPNHPWVFSSKGATGHALYNSGFLSIALAIKALENQEVPAITNLTCLDPDICIRVSTKNSVSIDLNTVLVNGLGFYGNYSSCLITRS